ncbi:MAG: hypothetical protein AAFP96_09100, partial [Bacteroidota bacterium]
MVIGANGSIGTFGAYGCRSFGETLVMKYGFVFFFLFVLGMGHPKSTESIRNSDVYTSKLEVVVRGSNSDGSVSKGGYVLLEIDGEDPKGIASFRIRIPSFYIHQELKSVGKKKRWNFP